MIPPLLTTEGAHEHATSRRHCSIWRLAGDLEDWGPRAGADVGEPTTRGRVLYEGNGIQVGIWECTPGGWTIQDRPAHETVQILSGRARTNADGTSTELTTGDVLTLPKGWSGRWDILENVPGAFFHHRSLIAACLPPDGGDESPGRHHLGGGISDPIQRHPPFSRDTPLTRSEGAASCQCVLLDLIAADTLLSEEEREIPHDRAALPRGRTAAARRRVVRGGRRSRPRRRPRARRPRRPRHAPARATAAPGPAPSRTGWRAWSSRRSTRASVPSCRCRAPW